VDTVWTMGCGSSTAKEPVPLKVSATGGGHRTSQADTVSCATTVSRIRHPAHHASPPELGFSARRGLADVFTWGGRTATPGTKHGDLKPATCFT
jgi:hypothetical protein